MKIWSQRPDGMWASNPETQTLRFSCPVWRLSWSIMGNILAVSQGDHKVSLWKEGVDGKWKNLSELQEQGLAAPTAM